MPDASHLLIPFAASHSPGGQAARQGLRLPNLERLLAHLTPAATDRDDPDSPPRTPPHERALARALDLPGPDGQLPWAACALAQAGDHPGTTAWAWFTPCHWLIGMDQVVMDDPARTALTEQEAQQLLAAVAPLAAEDGLTLTLDQPGRWLARGELLRELATSSPDRVIGQDVRHWMPAGPGARTLQRLHSELQMLLYHHPVNEARTTQRLPPVNAFWIHGAGALPTDWRPAATPTMPMALRTAALREDWPAWAHAWQQLDAHEIASLLLAAQRGEPVRLTLCSEHGAQTFESAPATLRQRLARVFARPNPTALLETL